MDHITIDWAQADNQEAGAYTLPLKLLSAEEIQSHLIREEWTVSEVEAVISHFRLLDDIPMVCKGHDCDFAEVCPLVKAGVGARFVTKSCPLEILNIIITFISYVNELNVLPMDQTDLTSIVDLCRISVGMSRCDKLLSLESPIDVVMSGRNNMTGLKSNQRATHPAYVHQEQLRASRIKLEDALTASRSSKEKMRRNRVPVTPHQQLEEIMSKATAALQDMEGGRFAHLEINDGP